MNKRAEFSFVNSVERERVAAASVPVCLVQWRSRTAGQGECLLLCNSCSTVVSVELLCTAPVCCDHVGHYPFTVNWFFALVASSLPHSSLQSTGSLLLWLFLATLFSSLATFFFFYLTNFSSHSSFLFLTTTKSHNSSTVLQTCLVWTHSSCPCPHLCYTVITFLPLTPLSPPPPPHYWKVITATTGEAHHNTGGGHYWSHVTSAKLFLLLLLLPLLLLLLLWFPGSGESLLNGWSHYQMGGVTTEWVESLPNGWSCY